MTKSDDDAEMAARLDRIQQLTAALTKARGDAVEQQQLAAKIFREIQAAKLALRPWP